MTKYQSPTNQQITLNDLQTMKSKRQPIACLTAYEASFARLIDQALIDIILVGDSLGMVVQGHQSTIPVSIDDMIYHCQCVTRAVKRALIMVDMPFMKHNSEEHIVDDVQRLLHEGGAEIVKVETDEKTLNIIEKLSTHSIKVCAHIGLLPQQAYQQGNIKISKKSSQEKQQLFEHAKKCVQAGAEILLAECIPVDISQQIAEEVSVPLIGIGSGLNCDGQILVMHDVIGASEKSPKFAKNFLTATQSLEDAFALYVKAVKNRQFPTNAHQI